MEKELLERLLDKAFLQLYNAIENGEGRMVIPERSENSRVSEQELKQMFIDTFLSCEQCKGYSYSVETPTVYNYIFTKPDKTHPKPLGYSPNKDGGRRGNIDVVIFEGGKRVALIEFKANNPGKFEHGKDFIKLAKEPAGEVPILRFFVEVYTSTDDKTLKKINAKFGSENEFYSMDINTTYLGYSLSHNGRKCVKLSLKGKCQNLNQSDV